MKLYCCRLFLEKALGEGSYTNLVLLYPSMFKNLLVGEGRKYTRNFFKVNITSKNQLVFSLDNFRKNFERLDILIPTFADVQKAFQYHVNKFPQAKETYVEIFGEAPIDVVPVEKIEEATALEKPTLVKMETTSQV